SFGSTAGAARGSANPLRTAPASAGNLTVDGPKPPETETVTNASFPPITISNSGLWINLPNNSWFQMGQGGFDTYLESLYPGLTGDVDMSLDFGSEPAALAAFAQANPGTVTT